MKDTIKRDSIGNRKLVIEFRFKPNPIIFDLKGHLLKQISESGVIPNSHWQYNDTEIRITDILDQSNWKKQLYIDSRRFSLISYMNETNQGFYDSFFKAFNAFKEVIKDFEITRIGCRVIGSYYSKSNDSKKLLSNFKALFPTQSLLEDYPVKDLSLQIKYDNGMYLIGPVFQNDDFVTREFPHDDTTKHLGFAIDTDNYVSTNKSGNTIKENDVKDVYLTSLSVEKSLFDKLNSL